MERQNVFTALIPQRSQVGLLPEEARFNLLITNSSSQPVLLFWGNFAEGWAWEGAFSLSQLLRVFLSCFSGLCFDLCVSIFSAALLPACRYHPRVFPWPNKRSFYPGNICELHLWAWLLSPGDSIHLLHSIWSLEPSPSRLPRCVWAADSEEQRTFNKSCLGGRFAECLILVQNVCKNQLMFSAFLKPAGVAGELLSPGEEIPRDSRGWEGQCFGHSPASSSILLFLSLIFQLWNVCSLQTSPTGRWEATPRAAFRPEPRCGTAAMPVIPCWAVLSSTARPQGPGAGPSRSAKVSLVPWNSTRSCPSSAEQRKELSCGMRIISWNSRARSWTTHSRVSLILCSL